MQVINNPPPDGGAPTGHSSSVARRSHREVGVAGNPAPGNDPTAFRSPAGWHCRPRRQPGAGCCWCCRSREEPAARRRTCGRDAANGRHRNDRKSSAGARRAGGRSRGLRRSPRRRTAGHAEPSYRRGWFGQTTPSAPAREESGTSKRRGSAGKAANTGCASTGETGKCGGEGG